MDKVRFGIITYPAAVKRQRGIAHLCRGNSWNSNVDRFGRHVLAVERDTVSVFAQVIIAPWSPIAANDVDLTVGITEASHQVVKKVEFLYVVIFDISGAVIAQEVV